MGDARGLVDFAVVGAQKAGTTPLNRCLGEHPEIYIPIDEVPYFEDPFFDRSDPSELAAALAPATPRQRRGIARPEYLARPECPPRLRDAGVDRIIAVVREPISRAVSAYAWYVQLGLLPLVPLEEGLQRLLDGWTDPDHPHAGDVLEMGRYATHLTRYLDVYPEDAVLVLESSEVRRAEGLARTFSFLGVDPAFRPPSLARTSHEGVYDPRRLRWLRLRKDLAFSWDDVDAYTYRPRRSRRPLALLPTAAVVSVDRMVLSRLFGNAKPEPSAGLRARLTAFYAPEVERLEAMTGRDLSSWRGPATGQSSSSSS